MGHGGWSDTAPIGKRIWVEPEKGEFVYPEDIDSDCKIVFLNGCGLLKYEDFVSRFKADVLISAEIDMYPIYTARESGGIFWEVLRSGDTVQNAVTEANKFITRYNQAKGHPIYQLKYSPVTGGLIKLYDEN